MMSVGIYLRLLMAAPGLPLGVRTVSRQQPNYQTGLGIAVEVPAATISLGKPIPVNVTFSNMDAEIVRVKINGDWAPEGLTGYAEKDGCRVESTPLAVERGMLWERSAVRALFPGEVLRVSYPPLDEIGWRGLGYLGVHVPGKYKFWVEFRLPKREQENGLARLWNGSVTSNAIVLNIIDPDTTEVQDNLEALSDRGTVVSDRQIAAVGYFRIVREPRAAGPLVELLSIHGNDFFTVEIAEAIVTQGRVQDAAAIRAAATKNGVIRGFLEELAVRLAAGNVCH